MKSHKSYSLVISLAAMVLLLFVTGCSSGVTRYSAPAATALRVSESNKVGEVNLALSAEAKEDLKDNLKFDQEELRKHVERALAGYAVLDASKKGQLPQVEILVTAIRVRSNFSAVMWGFMAGSDSIAGDVVIKDPTGKEIDRFKVKAAYALGGIAGGQDGTRLDWLYEAFAKETLKELTGTKD